MLLSQMATGGIVYAQVLRFERLNYRGEQAQLQVRGRKGGFKDGRRS